MTSIDRTWAGAMLAAGLFAAFMVAEPAQAARERGGGGGGGSARQGTQAGTAKAGARGGGTAKAAPASNTRNTATVNNTRADSRTNNVRSTSVNNVNVQRNVNVEVEGGCCHNGWDNDHPVATAAAVGATMAVTAAVIGSIVNAPPPGCVPVNYGGIIYQQCGTTWYQPQGAQYIVVAQPY